VIFQRHDDQLTAFAVDASRFVAAFNPAISHSYSRLPICPSLCANDVGGVKAVSTTILKSDLHQSGQAMRWPALMHLCGTRHARHIRYILPDGKRIVSGSRDRTIRVWDAETGAIVVGPLEGHTDYVTSVAFSPGWQADPVWL